MAHHIAVVSAACEFPDARSPSELWNVVLDARRTFRAIPTERLALSDYLKDDPDGLYPIQAGLIEGYRFDRERFLVPQPAYERTDLSHWMALDVATRAISSLDFVGGLSGHRDATTVIVANTLTGEFSRSNLLRYRWPYVSRAFQRVAKSRVDAADFDELLEVFEREYKKPFPTPDEESLAGGLSNTIAGRIANFHGLRGGAHTVDGACASSLIAIVNACERLASGDATCAVVGAVDLSLDPFELVGFARNGALSRRGMKVFDQESDGFWPGEGCGFVVLATERVTAEMRWPVLAWIEGSGISTDGKGGLTRPNADGQLLALRRAWRKAGLSPCTADYFEAHGTGTPTGDPIEIAALAKLIDTPPAGGPIPIGSIKANIGHTKAAAGLAGLLKAISICQNRVIPVTTGCATPHEKLVDLKTSERLAIARESRALEHDRPAVVGVNSFGFGGVNCHVVVKAAGFNRETRSPLSFPRRRAETAELIRVGAPSRNLLVERLSLIARRSGTLSHAEFADLAASEMTSSPGDWRLNLIATSPEELDTVARDALASLKGSEEQRVLTRGFSWAAPPVGNPRIAFLFPGQGVSLDLAPTEWGSRFECLSDAARRVEQLQDRDLTDTATLQPLIAEIASAGVELLGRLGIRATTTLGHSFGEMPAAYASGFLSKKQLSALSVARGSRMRDLCGAGAMLAIDAPKAVVRNLVAGADVDIACENGADSYVVSGSVDGVNECQRRCGDFNVACRAVPTTRPFHSRHMAEASRAFAIDLRSHVLHDFPSARLISSVTGKAVTTAAELEQLLVRQFTEPVQFRQALRHLEDADLVLELGAGGSLIALAPPTLRPKCFPIGMFGESSAPFLSAIGAAWVCGASLDARELLKGGATRPFVLEQEPRFIANPCGIAQGEVAFIGLNQLVAAEHQQAPVRRDGAAIEILRDAIARATGLSVSKISDSACLLSDLHINSIRARHIVVSVAKAIGISDMPFNAGELANASVELIASRLERQRNQGSTSAPEDEIPEGVAPWIRVFEHRWSRSRIDSATLGALDCAFEIRDGLAPIPSHVHVPERTSANDPTRCVLLVLPAEATDSVAEQLREEVLAMQSTPISVGLLVLQGAQIANAFLRCAALELGRRRICVVEYEQLDQHTIELATNLYSRERSGLAEIRIRSRAIEERAVALSRWSTQAAAAPWIPRSSDLVLVTGGGRGIGKKTVELLTARYGCRVAIVGRTEPAAEEIESDLQRHQREGRDVRYFRADLGVRAEAQRVGAEILAAMGPISAIVHASGINRPTAIGELTGAELQATVSAKVRSLENLLEFIPIDQLKLVIGFCSIIGEMGLGGEAHYALANDWLTQAIERYARVTKQCRCVPISWSAWAEAGMAARLEGVLNDLRISGVRPLETREALEMLAMILERDIEGPLIISGRYGRSAGFADIEVLQKHRYLESPRVFYPGVELIADATVSMDLDKYLPDHAPSGVPVLPLVSAIEAMASAAVILAGKGSLPRIENLQIGDPITFTSGEQVTLRTLALKNPDGTICAEVRSSVDRFRHANVSARLLPAIAMPSRKQAPVADRIPAEEIIYCGVTFHGERFHRLRAFDVVEANECSATTKTASASWYASLVPGTHVAGDPAIRDSVMHALQVCVPHHSILPVAVQGIRLAHFSDSESYTVHARETSSGHGEYVYDVDVSDQRGDVIEEWKGLRLRRVATMGSDRGARRRLPVPLLKPLLTRLTEETLDVDSVRIGFSEVTNRRAGTLEAIQCALGADVIVEHAPDGSLLVTGVSASASHAENITVAAASPSHRIAIDIELAPPYDEAEWQSLLGQERFAFACELAQLCGLERTEGCLVTWTISECLLKLGIDGWELHANSVERRDIQSGPVLWTRRANLRIVITLIDLVGREKTAVLAIALEDQTFPATRIGAPSNNERMLAMEALPR